MGKTSRYPLKKKGKLWSVRHVRMAPCLAVARPDRAGSG